jgi:hypothetical protein
MSCVVCKGTDGGVRHFAITVDGVELRVAPDLCQDHGDAFLLRVGKVLGEMLAAGGNICQRCPYCTGRDCGGNTCGWCRAQCDERGRPL